MSPIEFIRGSLFFGICFLFAWLEWQLVSFAVGLFTQS